MAASRGRSAGHEFLDPEEWQSFSGLLMLHRSVTGELDARLRKEHGLSVSEFDVLITLFNAPSTRLRMSVLAEQAPLSPAGMTHLVTRLERDGLVRREVDPTDGRKWFAVLTDAGDQMLREARVTHNDVLRATFLDQTSARERQTLRRIWSRLADRPTG